MGFSAECQHNLATLDVMHLNLRKHRLQFCFRQQKAFDWAYKMGSAKTWIFPEPLEEKKYMGKQGSSITHPTLLILF